MTIVAAQSIERATVAAPHPMHPVTVMRWGRNQTGADGDLGLSGLSDCWR